MSDKPQVGDKVRVSRTYEDGVELTWTGIVDRVSLLGFSFRNYAFLSENYSVEILERAKPKWRDGDVVKHPELYGVEALRFRIRDEWYTIDGKTAACLEDEYVLVMRDGRPV